MSYSADPTALQHTSRWQPSGAGLAYVAAAFLLLVPFFAASATALAFVGGITVTPFHLPVAVGLAAAATWMVARAEGLNGRDLVLALAVGVAVLAVAAFLADRWWDFSYDGQAYHQSSVRLLVAGWNPVTHALTEAETTHGLWLNHYVRAAELGAATLTALTSSLEAGKAFNITLVVTAALSCSFALHRTGIPRAAAALAALVVAANPIVLSQLPTFYVDGELALAFATALALAWISLQGFTRSAPFLLAAALVLLANVKFTGTVYAGLLLVGYLAAALWRRVRWSRPEVWAPAMAVAWTLAIAWQPLATNVIEHGNPFYPVAGAGHVDGQSGQTPYFRYDDPLRRLVQSTFSASDAARSLPQAKLPFVVQASEFSAMEIADVRIGGFGPLFGLAVIVAALGIAALPWSRAGPVARAGLLVAGCVLVTALINRGAWWARFVPQIWIAVTLACIALASTRRASRWLGLAALAVLTTDAAIVATCTVRHQVETKADAVEQARELARRYRVVELPRGEMESLDLRLARLGVRARYVASCARTDLLAGTYALYCQDSDGLPPAARAAHVVSRP